MDNESNYNSEEQVPPVNVFQLIRLQKIQDLVYALDNNELLSNEIEKESGLSLAMMAVKEFTDENAHDILKRLMNINEGASLRFRDKNQQTALFIAAAQGKMECFNLLRQNGFSITDVNTLGQTCLFLAAENNQYPLFRHLFAEENFDPKILNHKDTLFGHTILFYAAMRGHTDLCNFFVQKGADAFIIDKFKQTAKDYASSNKHKDTAKYLRQVQKIKLQEINDNKVVEVDCIAPKRKSDIQSYKLCKLNRCTSKEMKPEEINELLSKYRQIQEVMLNPDKIPKEWFEDVDQGEDWRKIAIKVVGQCINLKCAYWFIKIPAYHQNSAIRLQKISNIIDLNTIRYKLEHHCYRTSKDFLADMHLLWGTCEKMPGQSKLILEYARELKTVFLKMLQDNSFFEYN